MTFPSELLGIAIVWMALICDAYSYPSHKLPPGLERRVLPKIIAPMRNPHPGEAIIDNIGPQPKSMAGEEIKQA